MTTSDAMRKSLARHRDDGALPLRLDLPVHRLLDDERCEMVTRDLRRLCGDDGWEVRRATPNLGRSIPAKPGLYMFVWRPYLTVPLADPNQDRKPWFVLYVGQAGADGGKGTLRSRYTGEYGRYVANNPEKLWDADEPTDRQGRLGCYLNLEELEYWFIVSDETGQLASLERRLIRLLNPPLNDQGGMKLRVTSRGPAF